VYFTLESISAEFATGSLNYEVGFAFNVVRFLADLSIFYTNLRLFLDNFSLDFLLYPQTLLAAKEHTMGILSGKPMASPI
jgi:hypothetical protein